MLKFFHTPFAFSGDKTAIPNDADPDGNVSYTEGYGFDYQRQETDPAAKSVERDKQNELFFDVTNAIAEIQSQGVPDFISSALNGGTAYSYAINALVRYSGDVYLSLAATNTAIPTDATKWALIPNASRLQHAAVTSAVAGGTADVLTATFVPAITALPAAPGTLGVVIRAGSANATTTPTFSPDGLTAKTIVKGSNQALAAGDIAGAGQWLLLQYDATLDKWVLLNPAPPTTFSAPGPVQGAFKNLAASATGTSANVSVTADEVCLQAAAGTYYTARTVSLTIAGTSTGANGLDTGSLATSTWYSVWVIYNGTTVAGLLSTSATSPTMPSGYTYKTRVGWIRTDGTANKYPLGFKQYGRRVQYVVASGSNVTALPIVISGVQGNALTPTWVAGSVSAFVPTTASAIRLLFSGVGDSGSAIVAPNNSYGGRGSATNPPWFALNGAQDTYGGIYSLTLTDMLLESTNIYFASSGSTNKLQTIGWEDNL